MYENICDTNSVNLFKIENSQIWHKRLSDLWSMASSDGRNTCLEVLALAISISACDKNCRQTQPRVGGTISCLKNGAFIVRCSIFSQYLIRFIFGFLSLSIDTKLSDKNHLKLIVGQLKI